jgi:hypothetical protein
MMAKQGTQPEKGLVLITQQDALSSPMDEPMDELQRIEIERAQARSDIEAAEAAMKAHSRDPAEFRKAKKAHESAVETLERLEWAEKAERERQAGAELQAKKDALRQAQTQAREAHQQTAALAKEVQEHTGELVARIRMLQAAQMAVDRGAHYESFGVRDGYLDKQTVSTQLPISSDLPVLVLRAGRELAKLAGMSAHIAEVKAAQGKL